MILIDDLELPLFSETSMSLFKVDLLPFVLKKKGPEKWQNRTGNLLLTSGDKPSPF